MAAGPTAGRLALQFPQRCTYHSPAIASPTFLSTALTGRVVASTGLVLSALVVTAWSQPIPVDYSVHLASATSYDTRSRDEDTIHAALSVFVNGERRGVAIWDGKGWDGSRAEGRRWVSGLHLFGPSTGSTVEVSTGRLAETDSVEIVFQILNAAGDLSSAGHDALSSRIQRSSCVGGDGMSAWDCLVSQTATILGPDLPPTGCDGLVAADKLAYPAMQLRRKTETGDTITVNNVYRGISAPPACGQSIYAAVITIARR